jgi:hypothetical protein
MRKTIITMHAHILTEQDVSGLSLAPTTPAPLSEDMPTLAPVPRRVSIITVSGNFNPYESIRILPLAMVYAIAARSGF